MRTVKTNLTAPIIATRLHNWSDKPGSLDTHADICHAISAKRGWWNDANGVSLELNVGERIALMHSELSEALEAARKDLPSDHISGFSMLEEEMADTLIRIFDFSSAAGLHLHAAFLAKCHYNLTREDHSKETREGEAGKQF